MTECLGCSRLEMPDCKTVVLLTGQTVCTSCVSWLTECRERQEEANAILRMADRETRRAYLEAMERRHGAEYRRRLEAVVLETWERRRRASAGA